MRVQRVGTGAGGRDPAELPNVVRLVLGEPADAGDATGPVVLETNVDDLDPRLWPGVLDALFAAGASDAWLTPILMKKGRPAHTLSALCRARGGAGRAGGGLRDDVVHRAAGRARRQGGAGAGARVGRRARRPGGGEAGRRRTAGWSTSSVEYEDVAALARELGPAGQGGAAGRHRRGRGGLSGHWPDAHSASRRSASSGLTSSTRVMTAQR